MSQVFVQQLDDREHAKSVGGPQASINPIEPSSAPSAQSGLAALRGFPDEGITIFVGLGQTVGSSTKSAVFRDGSVGEDVGDQGIVSIFLSNDRMVKCSRKSGVKHFYGLSVNRDVAVEDEVLCDLAMCLNFNRTNPKGSNSHFADQIVSAICAHVIQKYSQERSAVGRASNQLSPWQLRIAKQMLCGDMRTTPNLAEVAEACRISTRHFTRSFTETIGTSPHQWSVLARLEHAKVILEDRAATLAETAVTCGFSDQSHFTRVFTREFGTSPARWRRSLDIEPN